MATVTKRRTTATKKRTIKRATAPKAQATRTVKAAPKRAGTPARAKRSAPSVVVLSGSTPLRRRKAAEVVAEELQLDLLKVNLASVLSRYVGETEMNINRVFDEAERLGTILFFDGADTLFGRARTGRTVEGRDAAAAHLLQRIESHQGLVIVTTDGESRIDRALSRQTKVSLLVGMKARRKPAARR